MDISEIRRHNTRLLADTFDTLSAFADHLGRQPAQIGHWIGKNPSRNIGPNVARSIEACFDKPRGWLDIWHADLGEESLPPEQIRKTLDELARQGLEGNARALRLAGFIMESWDKGLLSDKELTLMEKMLDTMIGFDADDSPS